MERKFKINGSVLLLGEAEDLVYIDRKMLAACGARRPVFASDGLKTARFLAELDPERLPGLVVCAGLSNMSGEQWLELVRLHPKLSSLPVVLILGQLSPQIIVEAAKLGAAALLARPYTQVELENAIASSQTQKSRLQPCPDASMFEQALASLETTQENSAGLQQTAKASRATARAIVTSGSKPAGKPGLESGVDAQSAQLRLARALLRQGRATEALAAFNYYLETETSNRGQALEGVAEAKAELGQTEKSRNYLQQAAVAYIQEENFMAARALFARLYGDTKQPADNPLYRAGARLVREGRFQPAAQAFMQGQVLTPEVSFHIHAARACQFASDPERCAEEICWHLERRSPSLGRQLRSYLLTPAKPEPEEAVRPGLWGLIREVVEVARYTARVHAAG